MVLLYLLFKQIYYSNELLNDKTDIPDCCQMLVIDIMLEDGTQWHEIQIFFVSNAVKVLENS